WRLYRACLYKVGTRLAFSYLLLGVLPIPLLLLLLTVLVYILSGFYMGHLYRDAVQSLPLELSSMAETRLDLFTGGRPPRQGGTAEIIFGYYRGGKRIAG